jgi:diaminohydroxyphosphoribosylaminopyrimidine deaminase/5-amino-6-(5-phosphoribosylamino)uracil reductase
MSELTQNQNEDGRWMRRALELARHGVGLSSPNPAVGCVILDSAGQVAGEGWHEYERRDHAEVVALHAARERARGGTAYVTLEPCNHTGRTGPCSMALIEAGVARVVAATVDPNPLVAGTGLERLRNAGVAVAVGVEQTAARRLNEGFARWIQSNRPLVHMKVAMSLDGRIAPARQAQGESFWITGEAARAEVQQMRWQADAVLTGIETVLADDPLLTDRSGKARRRPLLRVVLDSDLRLPPAAKITDLPHNDLVVFTVTDNAERRKLLESRGVRVEVLEASADGRVPLAGVLQQLSSEGILTLLTETGTKLNTALLRAGLVDRMTVFTAPMILGDAARPAFGELNTSLPLEGAEHSRFGADCRWTTLLRDPWRLTSK